MGQRTVRRHSLFVLLVALCLACGPRVEPARERLRIGLTPDVTTERLHARFEGLLGYLSSEVGLPNRIVRVNSYEALIEAFEKREIDVGNFGGWSFVEARERGGAVPLVMRDVDLRFTSAFVARADDHRSRLKDFEGARFAFGARRSTSGHLMPRYFLEALKLIPEDFFSDVAYSGKHDLTLHWVRDGNVDLGAANATIARSMLTDGSLREKDLKIVWESPSFANYVWACQPDLPDELQAALRGAFLKLDPRVAHHATILRDMSAGSYRPASPPAFDELARIANRVEFRVE